MGQAMERAWVVDGGEGISIERHSPPTGHCRHTLHTANIVPIDNVEEEEEEEDRVIRRRKGETSRQQKGGGGCPGQGALEVGGQGALSSAAVPMLAALPPHDKLLLFMTTQTGSVAQE